MAVVDISNTFQMSNPGEHIDNTDVYNSNRNLLDNWWWGDGEPVNQRSFTSGQTTHNAYCIDRWKTSYGSTPGTISLNDNGLTITAASGTYALINQVIERYSALSGKTVTASALLSNGTIVSGTVANLNWANNPIVVTSGNVRLQLLSGGYFRVTILNGGSATIRAVKLELGSYSTLANDVPPDYGEELLKCRRYFIRVKGDPLGIGYITSGLSTAYILIPTGVTMRTTPSVAKNGDFRVRVQGNTLTVNSMAAASPAHTGGGVGIACSLASSASAVGTCALYENTTTGYIDLSADL